MDWWSAEVPPAEECVLGTVLRQRAVDEPDAVYAIFEDDERWTYRDTLAVAEGMARGLRALGVTNGDPVLSWLPNGPDALRTWFGANLLGAIYVPLNTAYRGRLLEHAVGLSEARVAVVHVDLVPRLAEIDAERLEHVIVVGGSAPELPGIVTTDDAGTRTPGEIVPDRPVEPWDPYAVILTSGTTGPSKGVVCSYVQLAACAGAAFAERFGPGDRYMVNLPLFHAGGTIGTAAAVLLGAGIALVDGFATGTFWDEVRRTGTTHVTLLGVMATFLVKQPPATDDRDHPLRCVFMVPLVDDSDAFIARFGVEVVAMFNMTELSIPIVSEANPSVRGTCGRLRRGVEARIVDHADRELPDGEVGELIVRATRPWALNSGYRGAPEATAEAWRNGWFHTGDAFRRVDGEYFFVDRGKDTIRRRGENISSFEVEVELAGHEDVREAAAVAVPSEHGEDDVLAVIAPVPGREIDPVALIEYLAERMAHFMVPRYVRVLDELPRTPTNKVEKHRLRSEGLTADTWDRERAGLRLRRQRLGQRA